MPPNSLETLDPDLETNFHQFRSNGGGFSVLVDPFALSQLEAQIRESLKAIRGRGVETGGLILGHEIDWDANRIVITGFVNVDIEYKFGPLFRASEADLESFKQAAALAGHKVIGYFRSQLRSGMLIRDEDVRLLNNLFPQADCCFAPVEATANTPSVLSLHKVRAGQLPLLAVRFPLTTPEIADPGQGEIFAQELLSAPDQPESESSVRTFTAVQATSNRAKSVRWIAGVCAAILIGAVAYEVGRYSPGGHPSPVVVKAPIQAVAPVPAFPGKPKIEIHLADVKDQVEARWNSADPWIQNATRGFLIIFDSHDPKRIELDQARLRSGVYRYTPVSNTVTFWITVYEPDGSFLGDTQKIVRSVSPAAPPVPLAKQVAKKSTPPKTLPPQAAPPPKLPRSSPAPIFTNTVVVTPAPVRSPVVPDPPPGRVVSVASPQLPVLPAPAPPPDPALSYKTSVNRSVPARVVHQASPSVPIVLASKIRAEVQIEVAVQIDSTGRVTGTRVASSKGPLAGQLAIEALKAAQLCRFSPAQEDGHPVSSNITLTFRFAPRSN